MELCLGTAQWGMNYGIRGQQQPAIDHCMKMFDYAINNGIVSIDTANSYGTAEDVVGEFIRRKTVARHSLSISSKVHPNILDECPPELYYQKIRENLHNSLARMHTDYLDVYLFHSARYVYNEEMLVALSTLKQEGLVRKVGVSIYEPQEAKAGIASDHVDFLQLPYSLFDQRMGVENIFELAQSTQTQVHIRSVFVQGLLLMNKEEVPSFLERAVPIVEKIDNIAREYNVSRIALAMNYVQQTNASHMVIGVDNIEQLTEDINAFTDTISDTIVRQIASQFKGLATDIVMPSLWSRN